MPDGPLSCKDDARKADSDADRGAGRRLLRLLVCGRQKPCTGSLQGLARNLSSPRKICNPPAESMLSAGGLQIFRGLLRFLASPCRLPVQGFCRPHTSSRSSRRPAPRSASESALRASSLQDSGPSGTDRAANPHSRAPPRAWQWGSRPGSYLTAYSKFLLFLPCNLLP